MQLERFRGRELSEVVRHVRRTLGDDAMIVSTEVIERPTTDLIEVLALEASTLDSFTGRLTGGLRGGLAAARRVRRRRHVGPYVIALVGPSGAGKTATAVKLALHPEGLGTRSVGFMTLDTYRVGAVEELEIYAEIADIPFEVVYDAREVPEAMARLRDTDVVLVDTPGRPAGSSGWVAALRETRPDEVHLVIPAGLRMDVAVAYRERFESCKPSHALFTKLEEVPGETGLADVAEAMGLPTRWVTDGTDLPGGLSQALPRIIRSLGRTAGATPLRRLAV